MSAYINFEAEAEHIEDDEVSDYLIMYLNIHLLTITIRIQMLIFTEVLQMLKMTLNRF